MSTRKLERRNPLNPFSLSDLVDPVVEAYRRAVTVDPPDNFIKLDIEFNIQLPNTYSIYGILGAPESPHDAVARALSLVMQNFPKAALSLTVERMDGLTVQTEAGTRTFWHCMVVGLRKGATLATVRKLQTFLLAAIAGVEEARLSGSLDNEWCRYCARMLQQRRPIMPWARSNNDFEE